MSLSMGVRSHRWAAVAAVLVLVVVMAITAATSKSAREHAGGRPLDDFGRRDHAGVARADSDTLDLQLD